MITQTLIELVKYFESLHDGDLTQIGLQPKMCPAGVWTVGYGHAILVDGKFLKGSENKDYAYKINPILTEQEAIKLLETDLTRFETSVKLRLKQNLKQYQIDALISHAYNCGYSETLFKYVNLGNDDYIKSFWLNKYITVSGNILKGLVKRRKVEYNLYSTGKLDFNA